MRRVIIAITGASGTIFGVRMLEVLRDLGGIETHLIMSAGAEATMRHEIDRSPADIAALADVVHDDGDLAASIASGSFRVDAMAVAPCSIKTLSGIANSYDDNLVVRAADVRLKERQPLLLLVRETPLHVGHLRLMTQAAEAGAIIFPPVPSMYINPKNIGDLVEHTVMRALDQLGIATELSTRWTGLE